MSKKGTKKKSRSIAFLKTLNETEKLNQPLETEHNKRGTCCQRLVFMIHLLMLHLDELNVKGIFKPIKTACSVIFVHHPSLSQTRLKPGAVAACPGRHESSVCVCVCRGSFVMNYLKLPQNSGMFTHLHSRQRGNITQQLTFKWFHMSSFETLHRFFEISCILCVCRRNSKHLIRQSETHFFCPRLFCSYWATICENMSQE